MSPNMFDPDQSSTDRLLQQVVDNQERVWRRDKIIAGAAAGAALYAANDHRDNQAALAQGIIRGPWQRFSFFLMAPVILWAAFGLYALPMQAAEDRADLERASCEEYIPAETCLTIYPEP